MRLILVDVNFEPISWDRLTTFGQSQLEWPKIVEWKILPGYCIVPQTTWDLFPIWQDEDGTIRPTMSIDCVFHLKKCNQLEY